MRRHDPSRSARQVAEVHLDERGASLRVGAARLRQCRLRSSRGAPQLVDGIQKNEEDASRNCRFYPMEYSHLAARLRASCRTALNSSVAEQHQRAVSYIE